jgi:hypothetical protein
MSTLIQIKRTSTSNLPSSLDQGELAYIYDIADIDKIAGGNGGRLYIGDPTSSTNTPIKIGGTYYTGLLDHALGTLTASAGVIVDSNKKINEWFVDNLGLDGNTISSTDTNGNITLAPNGTGKTVIQNVYIGDANTTLEEYIEDITGGAVQAGTALTLTYDDVAGTITLAVANAGINTLQLADTAVTTAKLADSAVTTAKITDANVTTAKLADDSVTTSKVVDANITTTKIADLAVTTGKLAELAVTTGKLADTAVTTGKIADANVTTDKIADANVTSVKLAPDSVVTSKITDLNVTTAKIANNSVTTAKIADGAITKAKIGSSAVGATEIEDGAVTNAKLVNDGITIGDTDTSLGGTITDITGLTSVVVDNLSIDGNGIVTTNTDGNLGLAPNGEGTVTVPAGYEGRTGFTADSLVNKQYVDNVASGLDVKESVQAATTASLDAVYDNDTGTLTGSANGALTIDTITGFSIDARVLVKNQTDATQNGIYTVTDPGVAGSAVFVLTRAPDADSAAELTGGTFFFVERGATLGDAGFVATHNGVPTFGSTEITFEQFSGAGQISDGAGLSKAGNTLNVNVDDTTIEINGSDNLQIKDSAIVNSKVAANAAIVQSKLNLNSASTRSGAAGITSADLGVVSFNSNQFTTTNGWATVTRLDAGAYS